MKSNDNGEPLVGNDRFEGFCVDMIKILAERCNFTYLLRQQAHKQYGAKRDNGSWDGMIGELIRGASILLTVDNIGTGQKLITDSHHKIKCMYEMVTLVDMY